MRLLKKQFAQKIVGLEQAYDRSVLSHIPFR